MLMKHMKKGEKRHLTRADRALNVSTSDAIMFSCNRANEFEFGCEDCARCSSLTGTGRALLDWESDHSPYHEGFKHIRVVSRLKPPISKLSSELSILRPSYNSTSFINLIQTVQVTKATKFSAPKFHREAACRLGFQICSSTS